MFLSSRSQHYNQFQVKRLDPVAFINNLNSLHLEIKLLHGRKELNSDNDVASQKSPRRIQRMALYNYPNFIIVNSVQF